MADRRGALTRPARGDLVDVRVTALAHGGAGVSRTEEGYVVFVQGAIPGDRVTAKIGKRKRAYAEARLVDVVEPSPDRIAPAADHPGAAWQVLPYERQLEHKSAHVDDALRRIGKLDGFTLNPIVPAVEQWRYRNKLEFSFGTNEDGGLSCGFHAPGSWHEIVHVDDCMLQSERGNEIRRSLVTWAREQGYAAHDRRDRSGVLRHVVMREGRRTGEHQLRLVIAAGAGGIDTESLAAAVEVDSLVVTELDSLGETTAGGESELVAGSAKIAEEVCGLRFRLSPEAFFQTNTEMAERLYAITGEAAALQGWERLFDLYCGIGTIGLTLAGRAGEVWGLELIEEAIADAIDNARANEISNARFFAGDTRLALRDLVEEAGRPDVVIVDPPRAGLSQKVVRRIIEAAPKRIVYVSCNPTTLAPNAAQLAEAGYSLGAVTPVDMFPQTPHVECVAVFDRA
ncbi:MAG: 23S rRNA (uracil(1939)-C(5))-methyltransferase RlmD [Baekduia sp.]